MAWYPTIDHDTCVNDQACVEACPEQVILWNDAEGRVEVSTQDRCPPACRECADLCPLEAISFAADQVS